MYRLLFLAALAATVTGCSSDRERGAGRPAASPTSPDGGGADGSDSGGSVSGGQDTGEADGPSGSPDGAPDAGGPNEGNGQGTDPGADPGTGTGPSTAAPPATGAAAERLTQTDIARRVFDPRLTSFDIRVFHEVGAEPYTGRLGLTSNDTWDITRQSYADLFAAHTRRTVSVPRTLDRMQAFPDQGVQDWSIAELIELGRSLAPALIDGDTARISVIFVNGLFDGRDGVLGIHPTNSPFSFVFKDVVESVGGDATTQRYVEQTTVVHEIGHTIGFVDNGVPMVNGHEDAEHPHHTTDRDGVMYWAVESRDGALAFLTDVITGGRLSLFGPAATLDAQNYMPTD